MRSPKDFFQPLAVGAPQPLREIPFRPSRMIHFFPASNEKMRGKVPGMVGSVDVLLANLEDGVPATDKEAGRSEEENDQEEDSGQLVEQLRERLLREVERNVALRVAPGASRDEFHVSGRGAEAAHRALRERIRAPELDGGAGWINTDEPITLRSLRGKLVLLDFWTFC